MRGRCNRQGSARTRRLRRGPPRRLLPRGGRRVARSRGRSWPTETPLLAGPGSKALLNFSPQKGDPPVDRIAIMVSGKPSSMLTVLLTSVMSFVKRHSQWSGLEATLTLVPSCSSVPAFPGNGTSDQPGMHCRARFQACSPVTAGRDKLSNPRLSHPSTRTYTAPRATADGPPRDPQFHRRTGTRHFPAALADPADGLGPRRELRARYRRGEVHDLRPVGVAAEKRQDPHRR